MCAICAAPLAGGAALAQTGANRAGNAPAAGRAGQGLGFTQEELAAAIEFMKLHGPHRLNAAMNRLPGPREQFERNIVNQKRTFDRLQGENPELYQVRVREYEVNDDIFELCRQMRPARRGVSSTSIQPQLKEKVSELFDLGIKDQQLRIDKLERDLATARKALDSAQKNRDQLVAQNIDKISKEGVPGALFKATGVNTANPGEDITASPAENKKK